MGWSVLSEQQNKEAESKTVNNPLPDVHPNLRVVTGQSAMMGHVARPETLQGKTYKIKTPVLDYSLYVTINDLVSNEGTEFETRRPFEVFVNSKNMDNFQWIVALTRVMSAVFHKGGDIDFLADELKVVFDPRGGYFRPGGVYMPSVVAEIGCILERHLSAIKATKDSINSKARVEVEDTLHLETPTASDGTFPPNAVLCTKCNHVSLVVLDNCQTCLNCGFSKCG